MIDQRAIIDPSAKIAEGVEIGPWSIIGADVTIDTGTKIGPHVIINGPTDIGKSNRIYQFTSIGEAPQCLSYRNEPTRLCIGDHNIIREFCTISRGTANGKGVTQIGDHNYLMAYAHIAHDCQVGSHVIFANNASLSGHVIVDDYASFGGFSAVHQRCRIGSYCFVSGETSVVKDVPPYVLVSGHPAKLYGLNVVGLKRNGFDDGQMAALRKAYNIIYRQNLTIAKALDALEMMVAEHPEVSLFMDAINSSTRGITR